LGVLSVPEVQQMVTQSFGSGEKPARCACYLPGATEHHGGLFAGPGIAHRQLVWDWNHDAPEAEHWMRGLLAPDPSVLRLSGKFPADPVYAPR
jgi:hypothetical protein